MNCTDVIGYTHSDGYCLCTEHGTKTVWSKLQETYIAVRIKDPGSEDGRVTPIFACEETDTDLICDPCFTELHAAGKDVRDAIILEANISEDEDKGDVCCVCGKPAEGDSEEEVCNCVCPECGEDDFDDQTLADHAMCYDCFQKYRRGELPEEEY